MVGGSPASGANPQSGLSAIRAGSISLAPAAPIAQAVRVPAGYETLYVSGITPPPLNADAPKGTPMPILEKIARDIESLISNTEFRQELESKAGGTFLRSSPAAFAREQQVEFRVWNDYFTAAGIKPE